MRKGTGGRELFNSLFVNRLEIPVFFSGGTLQSLLVPLPDLGLRGLSGVPKAHCAESTHLQAKHGPWAAVASPLLNRKELHRKPSFADNGEYKCVKRF